MHPPLLGPTVWGPCAAELTAAGHRVAVPDLRAACDPPAGWPDRAAAAAAAAAAALTGRPAPPAGAPDATPPAGTSAGTATGTADGTAAGGVGAGGTVVVGHSGAGLLLPLIAQRTGAAAVVFVDALVPAADGTTAPSERFRSFLDQLPLTDGRLPRWPEWWPPAVMEDAVPDPVLRTAIVAEAPRLRRDFYAEAVPVPADWAPPRVGYLQLSAAYDADAAEAARRGWPVRALLGTHLDMVSRPAEVSAEILALG